MKKEPIIGVTPLYDQERKSLWMLPGYFDGVRNAGGIPVMLPLNIGESEAIQLYSLCDGLLFTGGQDIDPALYGEAPSPRCGPVCPARDALEKLLFHRAYEDDLPALGICRGIQLFNVMLGGTLYQDLPTQRPGGVSHAMKAPYDRPCHTVTVDQSSSLGLLLGKPLLGVNSYHHQAVRTLAPGLSAMAWSADGLVEAVRSPDRRFLWAVQWHPEFSHATDPDSAQIFRAFVDRCRQ